MHKPPRGIIRDNRAVCAEGSHVKGMRADPALAASVADVGRGEPLR